MGRKVVERGEDESAESQEDWDKVEPEGDEFSSHYSHSLCGLSHWLIVNFPECATLPTLIGSAESPHP
jgi:hypothetical protein